MGDFRCRINGIFYFEVALIWNCAMATEWLQTWSLHAVAFNNDTIQDEQIFWFWSPHVNAKGKWVASAVVYLSFTISYIKKREILRILQSIITLHQASRKKDKGQY